MISGFKNLSEVNIMRGVADDERAWFRLQAKSESEHESRVHAGGENSYPNSVSRTPPIF